MVAVVTGEGLGLLGGSLNTLGSRGLIGSARAGSSGSGLYINAANGNLVLQRQDEFLVGRGPDLGLLRTYNSQGKFDGDNDDGWRVGFYRTVKLESGSLSQAGSRLRRTAADGSELLYVYDVPRQAYVRADEGGDDKLRIENDQLVWVDGATQLRETYEPKANSTGSWRIKEMSSLDNDRLSYDYDKGTGLLKGISTANGESMLFNYNGKDKDKFGQLDSVTLKGRDGQYVTTEYKYDAKNRLEQVQVHLEALSSDLKLVEGQSIRTYKIDYGYDEQGRLKTVNEEDGTHLEFVYGERIPGDGKQMVTDVVDHASGRRTVLSYGADGHSTRVREMAGKLVLSESVLDYRAGDGALTAIETLGGVGGALRTQYHYDGAGRVQKVIDARGNKVVYEYDSVGHLIAEIDDENNQIKREYQDGRLLSEKRFAMAGEPALESSFIYEGHRLRFSVSAEGRVVEYRYNALGQRITEFRYSGELFVKPRTRDELANWAKTQQDGQRVEHLYDLRGQLERTTTYDLTRFDSLSKELVGVTGSEAVNRFVYDHEGRLVKSLDANQNAAGTNQQNKQGQPSSFVYDGMGRLILSTDADGERTTYLYSIEQTAGADDRSNKQTVLTVRAPGGRVTIKRFDAAGNLISAQQAPNAPASEFAYDALGRLRYASDETSVGIAYLYDSVGRKVGEIDGSGALTEFGYNRAGQLAFTRRYAKPLAPETAKRFRKGAEVEAAVDLSQLRPAVSLDDRLEYRLYDKAGRLSKLIDAAGFMTQYLYDGAGRQIETVRYAQPVDLDLLSPDLPEHLRKPPQASSQDRHTYRVYDRDGKLTRELDAERYVTDHSYDGAGQLIQTRRYAIRLAEGLGLAATTLSLSADDLITQRRYNASGELILERDASGYVTEYQYDRNGNKTLSRRWFQSVEVLKGNTADRFAAWLDSQNKHREGQEKDLLTWFSYDNQNRLSYEERGSMSQGGKLVHFAKYYVYDLAGQVVQTWQGAPGVGGEKRHAYSEYDSQGRVTRELSGEGAVQLHKALTGSGGSLEGVWQRYGIRYLYDAANRRVAMIEPQGHKTVYYYDDAGRLQYTINALNEVSELRYAPTGEVAATLHYSLRVETQGEGGKTTEALKSLVASWVAKAEGSASLVERRYDRRGLLESETTWQSASEFRRQRYVYNAFGELEQRFERIGAQGQEVLSEQVFNRDRRGAVIARLSNGVYSEAAYDAFGRVVRQATGAAGGEAGRSLLDVAQAYDHSGRVIEVRTGGFDGELSHRTTSYDAFDRVLTQTDHLKSGSSSTSYRYDDVKRTVTVTSPGGVATSVTKNAFGETLLSIDALGQRTEYRYDGAGRVLGVTRADGLSAANQYDEAGNLLLSADESGLKATYEYDQAGRMLRKTVHNGDEALTTSYRFDGQGRKILETSPDGLHTLTEYSRDGQTTRVVVDPDFATLQQHFPELKASEQPAHLDTRYVYDRRGQQVAVERYNPAGLPISRVAYHYDDAGRRYREVVDPNGLALETLHFFDSLGRVAASRDPNGHVTTYYRDALGRVGLSVDALGAVEESVYDRLGRVVEKRRYDQLFPALRFDANKALLSEQIQTADQARKGLAGTYGATRLAYDQDGRLIWQMDGYGAVTQSFYDDRGNLMREIRYANAGDYGSVLTAETVWPVSDKDRVIDYVYDALNRPISQIEWERQGGGLRAVREVRSRYDAAGRVVQQLVVVPGASGIEPVETRYSYDAVGRRIREIDNEGRVVATAYDAAGRVKTVTERGGRNDAASGFNAIGLKDSGWQMLRTDDDALVLIDPQKRRYLITRDMDPNAIVEAVPELDAFFERHYGLSRVASTMGSAEALVQKGYGPALAALRQQVVAFWSYQPDAAGHYPEIVALGGVWQRFGQQRVDFTADGVTVEIERARSFDPVYLASRHPALRRWLVAELKLSSAEPPVRFNTATSSYQQALADLPKLIWQGQPVVTAADRVTRYEYDAAGRLQTKTDTAGSKEEYAYNALGQKKTYTNKLGGMTEYSYDAAGRLVMEAGPWIDDQHNTGTLPNLRIVTELKYDANGNLIERKEGGYQRGASAPVFGANARITRFRYDAVGRQTVLEQPSDAVNEAFSKQWDAFWDGTASNETYEWPIGQLFSANSNFTLKVRYSGNQTGMRIATIEGVEFSRNTTPDELFAKLQLVADSLYKKGQKTLKALMEATPLLRYETFQYLEPESLAAFKANWADFWSRGQAGQVREWAGGKLVRQADGTALYLPDNETLAEGERLVLTAAMTLEEIALCHPNILEDLEKNWGYEFDGALLFSGKVKRDELLGFWGDYWTRSVTGERLQLGGGSYLERLDKGAAKFVDKRGKSVTLGQHELDPSQPKPLNDQIRDLGRRHPELLDLFRFFKYEFDLKLDDKDSRQSQLDQLWQAYWSGPLYGETLDLGKGRTLRRYGPDLAAFEVANGPVYTLRRDMSLETLAGFGPVLREWLGEWVPGVKFGESRVEMTPGLSQSLEPFLRDYWQTGLVGETFAWGGGTLRREGDGLATYSAADPKTGAMKSVRIGRDDDIGVLVNLHPMLKSFFERQGFVITDTREVVKVGNMQQTWDQFWTHALPGTEAPFDGGVLRRLPTRIEGGREIGQALYVPNGHPERAVVLHQNMRLDQVIASSPELKQTFAALGLVIDGSTVVTPPERQGELDLVWQTYFNGLVVGESFAWAGGELVRTGADIVNYVYKDAKTGLTKTVSLSSSSSLAELAGIRPEVAKELAWAPGVSVVDQLSAPENDRRAQEAWLALFDQPQIGATWKWAKGVLRRDSADRATYVRDGRDQFSFDRSTSLLDLARKHADFAEALAEFGFKIDQGSGGQGGAADRLQRDWLALFAGGASGDRFAWSKGHLQREADGSALYIGSDGGRVRLHAGQSFEEMARLHGEIRAGLAAFGFVMGDEAAMLADWRVYFDQALPGESRSFGKGTLVRRADGSVDYRGANGVTVRLERGVTVEAAALLHPEIAEVFALEGLRMGERPVLKAGDLKALTAQWQSYFDRAQSGETMEWLEGTLTRQSDGSVLYRSHVFGGTTVLRRGMSVEEMARAHTGLAVAFSRLYGFRMESRATVLASGDQARMDAEWNAYFSGRFNGESLDWAGGKLVRLGDGRSVYQAPGGGSAVLSANMTVAEVARSHPALAAYFETQGFKVSAGAGNPTVVVGREAELLQVWNGYFNAPVLEKSYSLWGGTLVRVDYSTAEFHYGGQRYQLNRHTEIPALSQLVPEITSFYRRTETVTVVEINRPQLQSDWNLFWSTIPVGWSGSWGGGQITRTGPDSAFYRGNDGSTLSFGRGASLDTLLGNASIKKAFSTTRDVTTTSLDEAKFRSDWQQYWLGAVPDEATPIFDGTLTRKTDGSAVFANGHGSVAFNRQSNFSALYLAHPKVFGAWAAAFGYRLSTDGQVVDNRGEAALRGFLSRYFGGAVAGETISMWGGTLTRQADGSSRYGHPAGTIDMWGFHSKAGLAVQSATLARAWNERYGFKADMVPQVIERGREAELRTALDNYLNGRSSGETLSIYGGTLSRQSNGEVRFQNAQGSTVVKRDSDLLRLAAGNSGLAQAWKQAFGIEVASGYGVIERGNEAALQSLLDRYLGGRFEGDSVARWGGTLTRNADGSATFTSVSGSMRVSRDADLNQLAVTNKELAEALRSQYGLVPGKGVGAIQAGDQAALKSFWDAYWAGGRIGESRAWLGGTVTPLADGTLRYRNADGELILRRDAKLNDLALANRGFAEALKTQYGYITQPGASDGKTLSDLDALWQRYWQSPVGGESVAAFGGAWTSNDDGSAQFRIGKREWRVTRQDYDKLVRFANEDETGALRDLLIDRYGYFAQGLSFASEEDKQRLQQVWQTYFKTPLANERFKLEWQNVLYGTLVRLPDGGVRFEPAGGADLRPAEVRRGEGYQLLALASPRFADFLKAVFRSETLRGQWDDLQSKFDAYWKAPVQSESLTVGNGAKIEYQGDGRAVFVGIDGQRLEFDNLTSRKDKALTDYLSGLVRENRDFARWWKSVAQFSSEKISTYTVPTGDEDQRADKLLTDYWRGPVAGETLSLFDGTITRHRNGDQITAVYTAPDGRQVVFNQHNSLVDLALQNSTIAQALQRDIGLVATATLKLNSDAAVQRAAVADALQHYLSGSIAGENYRHSGGRFVRGSGDMASFIDSDGLEIELRHRQGADLATLRLEMAQAAADSTALAKVWDKQFGFSAWREVRPGTDGRRDEVLKAWNDYWAGPVVGEELILDGLGTFKRVAPNLSNFVSAGEPARTTEIQRPGKAGASGLPKDWKVSPDEVLQSAVDAALKERKIRQLLQGRYEAELRLTRTETGTDDLARLVFDAYWYGSLPGETLQLPSGTLKREAGGRLIYQPKGGKESDRLEFSRDVSLAELIKKAPQLAADMGFPAGKAGEGQAILEAKSRVPGAVKNPRAALQASFASLWGDDRTGAFVQLDLGGEVVTLTRLGDGKAELLASDGKTATVTRDVGLDVLVKTLTNGKQFEAKSASTVTDAELNGSSLDLKSYGRTTLVTQSQTFHDVFGNAVSYRDVAGNWSYKTYDDSRLRFEVDAEGYITEHRYDTFGNRTRLIRYATKYAALPGDETLRRQGIATATLKTWVASNQSGSREIQYEYDARGQLIKTIEPIVENFQVLNAQGATRIVSAGKETHQAYDELGRVVKQWVDYQGRPSGEKTPTTYFYYDRMGRKIGQIDAEGYLTEWVYDRFGQVREERQYASRVSAGLDETSAFLSVKQSALNLAYATDDLFSQHVAIDQETRVKRYGYDALGNLETETEKVRLPSGGGGIIHFNTTSYGYDRSGNRVQVKDARGHYSYQLYDAMGRLEGSVQASGENGYRLSKTTFDLLGNATKTVTLNTFGAPASAMTQAGLRAWWRSQTDKPTTSDSVYKEELRTFDIAGRTLSAQIMEFDKEGGKGRLLAHNQWRYDAFGRTLLEWQANQLHYFTAADSVELSTANNNSVKLFEYDRNGNQIGTRERIGLGDKPKETRPATAVETRVTYNAFGEIESRTLNGYETARYGYDAGGRLIYRKEDGVVSRLAYNVAGQESAKVISASHELGRHDSLATLFGQNRIPQSATADYRRQYTLYDALGRAVKQFLPLFDEHLEIASTVQYDRWGNQLEAVNALGHVYQWKYDLNNRVIEETLPISTVVDDKGIVHLKKAVTRSYFYDQNGDLRQKTDGNGNKRYFEYDSFGRQSEEWIYVQNKNSSTGAQEKSYLSRTLYDSWGRIYKQIQDVQGDSAYQSLRQGDLVYRYDALDRVVELTRQGRQETDVWDKVGVHRIERQDVTAYVYDLLGRKVAERRGSKEQALNATGSDLWITSNALQVQLSEYDSLGRVIASETAERTVAGSVLKGLRRDDAFDARGNKISSRTSWLESGGLVRTYDSGMFSWNYDLATNRLQSRMDLGGGQYTYQYNSAGELKQQIYERTNLSFEKDPGRVVKNAAAPIAEAGLLSVVMMEGGGMIERQADGRWRDDQGQDWNLAADGMLENGHGLRVSPRREIDKEPEKPPVVKEEVLPSRDVRHVREFSYDGAGRLSLQVDRDESWKRAEENTAWSLEQRTLTSDLELSAGRYEGVVTHQKRYDKLGNLLRESVERDWTLGKPSLAKESWQQTNTYDALGRLQSVLTESPSGFSTNLSLQYVYDGNGNRRAVMGAVKQGQSGLWDGYINWYAYDALDRMAVSRGVLENSPTTAGKEITIRSYQGVADGMKSAALNLVDGAELGFQDNPWIRESLSESQDKPIIGGGTRISYVGNTLLRSQVESKQKKLLQKEENAYTLKQSFRYDSFGRVIRAYHSDSREAYQPEGGLLVMTRLYDWLGRTMLEGSWDKQEGNRQSTNPKEQKDSPMLTQVRQNQYDADGRLLKQLAFAKEPPKDQAEAESKALSSTIYDYQGEKLKKMTFLRHNGKDSWRESYEYTYTAFDSWKETSQLREVTGSESRRAKSYSVLDDYGQTQAIWQAVQDHGRLEGESYADGYKPSQVRRFFTDSDGRVLWRSLDVTTLGETSPNRFVESVWKPENKAGRAYAYAGGSAIGSSGMSIEESDFDFNFVDLSANSLPQASHSSYTTNKGDTLKRIALMMWGDASLWYLIAQENQAQDQSQNLAGPDAILREGQTLKMPTVISAANKADTFRPYNPTKILGSTTPDLPAPPPPPKPEGCGVVGQVVMIVVMIIASVLTAGAAAAAMGATLSTMTTVLSAGQLMVVGALSGAAGSLASQVAGVAIGAQDKISWKAVGTAALSGAVTAGISASPLGKAIQGSQFVKSLPFSGVATTALTAMASSTINQGVMSAAGLGSFSWRNVAAAGIAAPITAALGDSIFGAVGENGQIENGAGWARNHQFAANFLDKLAGGTINRVAQIAVHGRGKVDMVEIATNAFGDAIGNHIVGKNRTSLYDPTVDVELMNDRQKASFERLREGGYSSNNAARLVRNGFGEGSISDSEEVSLNMKDSIVSAYGGAIEEDLQDVRFLLSVRPGVASTFMRQGDGLAVFQPNAELYELFARKGQHERKQILDDILKKIDDISPGNRPNLGILSEPGVDNSELRLRIAEEHLFKLRFEKAEGHLEQLRRIPPEHVDGFLGLGIKKRIAGLGFSISEIAPADVLAFTPYAGKSGRYIRSLTQGKAEAYVADFAWQIGRQEKAINELKIDEYQEARRLFKANGRNANAAAAQKDFAADFESRLAARIAGGMIDRGEDHQNAMAKAAVRAAQIRSVLAALHEPDNVAGGYSSHKPVTMGNSRVNSTIGASWKGPRLAVMDEWAARMKAQDMGDSYMNVRLKVRGRR